MGCGVWNVECGVWGVGCGVGSVGYGVWGVGLWKKCAAHTSRGMRSGFWDEQIEGLKRGSAASDV